MKKATETANNHHNKKPSSQSNQSHKIDLKITKQTIKRNDQLAIYNKDKKTSKIYETFVVYNPDYNPDEVKKKGRRES